MKFKFLLFASVLLFAFEHLNAQTWSTLGTAQYANDPVYLASDVDESTGNIYVAYVDQSDNDHLKVKYFDGTNWLDLGGTVSSIGNVLYPSVRVNPVTNDVWVAYRTDIAPGSELLMVKRFDGSSWITEGNNVSPTIIPIHKLILRFSPTGEAFIAYMFSSGGLQGRVISNRTGSWAFEVGTAVPQPYGIDFPSYRLVYYNGEAGFPTSTVISRRVMNATTYSWGNATTIIGSSVYPADNYQGLAATTGSVLIAMHNFNSTEDIDIATWSTNLTPPANSDLTDGKSLQLIRNQVDGLTYLLYVKTTGEVVVSSYDGTGWAEITGLNANIGALSGESGLRAKLSMRDSDGRMYVTYKDGLSITTKYFDVTPAPTKIFVDIDATGNNDGTSWADAFTSLQDGIDAAENSTIVDTVWVAEGTYKPHPSSRSVSYQVQADGVKIFGGFAGTETSLNQRNIANNPTIISGDLNDNDNPNDHNYTSLFRADNSYKLFYLEASGLEINGFTLTGAHANNTSGSTTYMGSVVYLPNQYDNFTMKNCEVSYNISNRNGNLHFDFAFGSNSKFLNIENCIFHHNISRYSGVIQASVNNSAVTLELNLTNSVFYENRASDLSNGDAGFSGSSLGIFANSGTINFNAINNTFAHNIDAGTSATNDKGTIVLRRLDGDPLETINVEMHNNVFWENYSDLSLNVNPQVIGLMNRPSNSINTMNFTYNNSNQTNLNTKFTSLTENNTTNVDPLFSNPSNGDYSLQSGSPMIDAGDNTQVPSGITEDILGNNRFENTTVDRGAYEFFVPNAVPPTVVTQDITVQLDANGQATIQPSDIDDGSTDDETPQQDLILSLDISSFDCNDIGANTVTLTVEDDTGNTATGTATVTVEDVTAPTVNIQNITVQLDVNGQATIQPSDINNGSTDNCSIDNFSLDITSFDCSDIGSNIVELTATDPSGNSASANATVTVQDIIAPTVVTQNVTVQLDASGNASIATGDVDNGSSDNCAVDQLSLDITSFTCADLGTNTVTLTVEDASGNSNTGTAIVTVVDDIDPVATTQNTTVILDANGQGTIQVSDINSGSTDNCGIATTSLDVTSFDCSNLGVNTVTLTVEDGSGNTASSTATVTVVDNTAPNVVAQNITVTLDANGEASITAGDIDNGTTDNCSVANLFLDVTDFTCADLGTNTVTLSAEDTESNTGTATATVTVVETTAPVAATQNITIALDANGEATITPADIDNGSTDNCGISTMSLDVTDFTCADLGTNTVTLTVEDGSGNTNTETAQVTVEDNIDPVAIVNTLTTLSLDANGQATLTGADVDNGSTDNCSVISTSVDISSFDCSHIGTTQTVNFTVTDASGNTATTSADVEIVDNLAPTVVTQAVTVTLDANGDGSITTTDVDNGSTDNCGIASMSLDVTDFTCADVGTNTVTLTVEDNYGNIGTETAVVTVIETEAPVAVTQDITIALDANGEASIVGSDIDNGSTDNCSIDALDVDITNFTCAELGANTVTLTVTDGSGNTDTETAIVTVEDNIDPIAIGQDITVQLVGGTVTIVAADVDNGTSDNCGVDNLSIDQDTFTAVGVYPVALTATDASGNSATTTVDVTVEDNVGINEEENDLLKLVPNPTEGVVKISTDQVIDQVLIYDNFGRLVAIENSQTVDLSTYAKGVYTFKISLADGSFVTHKVVKQ